MSWARPHSSASTPWAWCARLLAAFAQEDTRSQNFIARAWVTHHDLSPVFAAVSSGERPPSGLRRPDEILRGGPGNGIELN